MEPSREEQFVAQFSACQSRLYCFVAGLVVNQADAEDLFQQADMEARRCRETYDPTREFFPWICGIARNHIRYYYRRHKTAPLALPDHVVEQLCDRYVADQSLLETRQQALTSCLEKLPGRQRDFIRQFYAKAQSAKSFAQQQGVTAGATYKTLQRIRAALFDCIDRTVEEIEPC
jgi:RNA polymerase sigma-70 factor, ECF subfamily